MALLTNVYLLGVVTICGFVATQIADRRPVGWLRNCGNT
jgi:hypothetical protein